MTLKSLKNDSKRWKYDIEKKFKNNRENALKWLKIDK